MNRPTNRRAHAFTLLELLVVIGIVVLLVGLLLPITLRAVGAGETARMRADLVTIGTALDAYAQDYGRYPRVDTAGTGFAVLGQALIGPVPALVAASDPDSLGVPLNTALTDVSPGTVGRDGTTFDDVYVAVTDEASTADFGNTPNWQQFGQFVDGVEGAGFSKGADSRLTQDPYLSPDSFKINGSAILDLTGKPILYYPARAKKPNIYTAGSFVGLDNTSLFNANHNIGLLSGDQFAVLLGDLSRDGAIGQGEAAVVENNYVLLSPGSDQRYLTVVTDGTAQEQFNGNRTALEETDDVVVGG
ncbi:MAG: prepilin-type N-terminal cleavage/methylation domain-containing protein [Planctomycetota bacterium]